MVEGFLTVENVAQNIAYVRSAIEQACVASNRSPAEVTLLAVTKTVPIEMIRTAWQCGITHFGENRVQEAQLKVPLLAEAHWHLIGSLQTNKVKTALELFSCIHSVDRPVLVEALARQNEGKEIPVLMQVNVTGEASKHGVSLSDALALASQISAAGLRLVGLMTIPPLTQNPDEVRPVFRTLRELYQRIQDLALPGAEMRFLSMGMSGDFPVAIEEGATIVRVGSAIFGARPKSFPRGQ